MKKIIHGWAIVTPRAFVNVYFFLLLLIEIIGYFSQICNHLFGSWKDQYKINTMMKVKVLILEFYRTCVFVYKFQVHVLKYSSHCIHSFGYYRLPQDCLNVFFSLSVHQNLLTKIVLIELGRMTNVLARSLSCDEQYIRDRYYRCVESICGRAGL